jgi:hypothetical protein
VDWAFWSAKNASEGVIPLKLLILGAPYSSYTVYRRSLLEIERPDSAKMAESDYISFGTIFQKEMCNLKNSDPKKAYM